MVVHLGPVLSFRGATATTWNVSALWVLDAGDPAPKPVVTGVPAQVSSAIELASDAGRRAWRVDFAIARQASAAIVDYQLDSGPRNTLVVPAAGEPLQLGFASCNGFSDPKHKKKIGVRNERWLHLRDQHRKKPIHLLLLGGDQVYGDSLWRDCDLDWLAKWLDRPLRERAQQQMTTLQREAVASFYFRLYCERWTQPEPAAVLASIPTLMMWDDHDIFDGWGSHDAQLQDCDFFAGIFEGARRGFRTFQLQLAPHEAPPGAIAGAALSYALQIDDLGIVALDLRSERSPERLLEPGSWTAALAGIDALAAKHPKHLLVVSGPPVIFPSTSSFERIVDAIPGEQDVEDDLRDRWGSAPHIAPRETLIRRLLKASAAHRTRATILSGDVHMAALGVIESRDSAPPFASVINNLVSSPVVHAPPSKLAILALKVLDRDIEIAPRIAARMHKLPGVGKPYLAQRNWLRISGQANGALLAEWWVESRSEPFQKLIHPVG